MNRTFHRTSPGRAIGPRWFFGCRLLGWLGLLGAFSGSFAAAQTLQRSRITQPIDERVRVTLKGNVHPLAQARYDQGAVPDSIPVQRMLLLFQRSPERVAALRQFLRDAHTQGSPSYHKWLTPKQFGELYGARNSEIAAVAVWLQRHGFSVAGARKGKMVIEFSGSAGQLREAFGTEIHTYVVNGQAHSANNRDPQIPAALAPVIAGITPLHDFRPTPQVKVLGKALYDRKTHVVHPEWTIGNSPPLLALAPADFAVQYDLNPLYAAGIDGTGVNIGLIGASNVYPDVVANYRSFFGLPVGTLNIIVDGLDPGPSASVNHGNWAEVESFLDVEVSGAVAPGATVNLYTAADTTVQSGLLLAAQRAVDDDVASVLSTSYGQCEQALGSSGNQFWAALWEQAAAQGQTSLVSSGDSGSAGCDDFNAPEPAQLGLAVNGFSSTPWNISVGGTDFFYTSYNSTAGAQSAELASYWNIAMPSPTTPAASLLKTVHEQPWNQAFGMDLYDGSVYNPNQPTIVAGSGGASIYYPKPTWQSGEGVPADGARDLPDVALFAADGENDSFYPICLPQEDCTGQEITAIGGTSASSPAMAGIMALVIQKYGRQGQANFVLYPLAMQQPSVFHDISIGSNDVPCRQSSSSCMLSTANDNTKGFYILGHYDAGPGYDQATGLGSVDANLLVQYWNSLNFTASNTSLNLSQTTFTHGTAINVSVAVTGNGGTPTGDVVLLPAESAAAANISLNELTLNGGAASATVNNFPGGQYQLTARYAGDLVFGPSTSAPITLSVAPEGSAVSITGSYGNASNSSLAPIANGASYPYGAYIVIDAQPIAVNAPNGGTDGVATGTVTFTDTAGSNVSSGPLRLNAQGFAEWTPALSFPVGPNSLSASYSGDASFNASTSTTPLTFTITKASSVAFLDAKPSPVALGSATTLELHVRNQFSGPVCREAGVCTVYDSAPVAPTGTVSFTFGNTAIGTVPLVPHYNNLFASSANLSVSTLPLGKDVVTASYSGDANYISTTATFPVVVENAATLSAAANPSSINQGEFTQITSTVTGQNGLPIPTGTVSFSAGGSESEWNDTEPLKNGSASSMALPGGLFFPPTNGQITVPINVSYSGDSTYGPASVNVSLIVTQGFLPPFSVMATPVTIASPGATTSNTSTITVTPGNGFTGAVYLSCALTSSPPGAVHLPTCSAPSDALNITGTGAVTAVMTVNSAAPSSSASSLSLQDWRLAKGQPPLVASAGVLAVCFFLLGAAARYPNRRVVATFLFTFVIFGALVGCGGGSATTPPLPPTNPGTTAGTYMFTVNAALTANGVSQAQTAVTVTIQ